MLRGKSGRATGAPYEPDLTEPDTHYLAIKWPNERRNRGNERLAVELVWGTDVLPKRGRERIVLSPAAVVVRGVGHAVLKALGQPRAEAVELAGIKEALGRGACSLDPKAHGGTFEPAHGAVRNRIAFTLPR
jgi:hypothetical protein